MRRGCTHARSPDQTESPTGASDPEIIRVLTLSTRVAPLLSIHIRYCTSESREPPWSPGALPRYATSRLMHSRLGLAMSTFRYGRSDARGRPVHGAGVARSRRQTSAERRGDRTRTGHAPHALYIEHTRTSEPDPPDAMSEHVPAVDWPLYKTAPRGIIYLETVHDRLVFHTR